MAIQHYLKRSGILQDELFFSDVLKNASDKIDFLSIFFDLFFVICFVLVLLGYLKPSGILQDELFPVMS